jgi:glycosyltransferase 2 family protein
MQGDRISIFKKSKKVIPVVGFSLIIFWILKNLDFDKILTHLSNIDLKILLLVTILATSQIIFSSLRYHFFLKASNAKVALNKCVSAVMAAFSLNSIIPGKGGDLVKAMVLTTNKKKLIHYTAVTLVERLIDLSVIATLLFVGATLMNDGLWQLFSMLALTIFLVLVGCLNHARKIPLIGSKLMVMQSIIPSFKDNKYYLFWGIASAAVIWIINLIIIYSLLTAVGYNLNPTLIIANWPKAIVAGIMPLSISGFGTRDAAFALSIDASLTDTKVYAATFLYTVFLYWYLSVISIICILIEKLKAQINENH